MDVIKCNLCNSTSAIELFHLHDWQLQKNEHIAILVKCPNCGLVYQNPQPSIDELKKFYPEEYRSYRPLTEGKHQSWLLRKIEGIGSFKRIRFIQQNKKSGRLLDVGCSTGAFLKAMANEGEWDLYGVEVSHYAAEVAQKHTAAKIFNSTLELANFEDRFFDVVTLWDVLEHLHDPMRTLKEINRILKTGGILAIRTPNLDSWDLKIFGQYWAGFEPPRHLFVFNRKLLNQYFDKSGFDILQTSGEFGSYMTFVLNIRFWLTGRKVGQTKKDTILKILYSPFTRLILSPIFMAIGYGSRSPSITVIGKKREDQRP